MNCRSFQKQLYDYVDGALSPRVRAAADDHLEHCAACQRSVREEKRLAQSLSVAFEQTVASVELDLGLKQRIMRAVEAGPTLARSRIAFSPLRFALAVSGTMAAFLLLIAGGHFFKESHRGASVAGAGDQQPSHPVLIQLSYCVPTYTFEKAGDLVIDALTCDSQVVNESVFLGKRN